MNAVTYTISKLGTSTKIVSSTGEQYVLNNRVDYNLIGNTIVLKNCDPTLIMTVQNTIVTGQTFTTIQAVFDHFFNNKFFTGNE